MTPERIREMHRKCHANKVPHIDRWFEDAERAAREIEVLTEQQRALYDSSEFTPVLSRLLRN